MIALFTSPRAKFENQEKDRRGKQKKISVREKDTKIELE